MNAFLSAQIPFIENTGQVGGNTVYYARTLNGGFYVGQDGKITHSISRYKDGEGIQVSAIRESFPGVTAFLGQGEQKLAIQVNEFVGSTPSNTISAYAWLDVGQVAKGVNLQLRAYGGSLQKTFIVQPGADTSITARIEGSQGLKVNEQGDLEIATPQGSVSLSKPVAYQEVNGQITYVDVSYRMGVDSYGFQVGKYDKTKQLFIVPSTVSASLDSTDSSLFVFYDGNGNTYISGSTASLSGTDAFVARLDASSCLESLATLGGAGMTQANAVATDGQGNVYIAGGTTAPDFPVTPGSYGEAYQGQTDAFVTKFDDRLADLLASSFLSGSGTEEADALAVDQAGSVYVAGRTTSKDFPVIAGSYNSATIGKENSFLSKFDRDLRNLLASSLLDASNQERIASITINPNGTVSVNGFGSPSGPPSPFTATFDPGLGSVIGEAVPTLPKNDKGTVTETKAQKEEEIIDKEEDRQSPRKTNQVAGPGWFMAKGGRVNPDQAEAYYKAKQKENADKLARIAPLQMGVMLATTPSPEITELARALHNDPKLIYDYVHNNIDYVPYYGSLKGATLTYLDGNGNDFDQASLMISLLRAAGYSAQYVYGKMTIPGSQLANWLGVDSTWQAIGDVIDGGGGIIDIIWDDATTKFYRVWVKATINGTDYVFDPAYKAYSYTSKIDIGQATGYNRAALLAAAGGTMGDSGSSIQNMNETALRSQLSAYSSNLINAIKSQYPNSTVDQIVGGRSIVQTALTQYSTTIPFPTESTVLWDEIPDERSAKVRFQHAGIDYTIKTCDLSGKRLTLTYSNDTYHRAQLLLDGLAPTSGTGTSVGNTTTLGNWYDFTMTIDHPFVYDGGTYWDQTIVSPKTSGSTYAIVYSFGGPSSSLFKKRQQQLDIYRAQGLAESSEAVRGETLNLIGTMWVQEVAMSVSLLSKISDTVSYMHHNIGFASQETGFYVDMPAPACSISSKHDSFDDEMSHFKSMALIGSALEHGVIAQLMNSTAASTMSLFQIANSTGRKIFYVTSLSQFESTVWPQLTGYTSNPNNPDDLTTDRGVFRRHLNLGSTLFLPDNGRLTSAGWTWVGEGYIAKLLSSGGYMAMMISGNYNGGYSGNPGDVNSTIVNDNAILGVVNTPTPSTAVQQIALNTPSAAAEPVDMASGAYLYDRTDLALGNGAPLGLSFSRSYNSNVNLTRKTLGYGWTHNYDIRVAASSHGEPVFGYRQPVDTAGMVVALYTCFDLIKNGADALQPWMATFLTAKWAMDQAINNAVTVNLGSKVMEYIKLADGTYAPPSRHHHRPYQERRQYIHSSRAARCSH
jgi:transglutaminase-like putative cysteine protease